MTNDTDRKVAERFGCYYCKRPIPTDVVLRARVNRVPVVCICRPGAMNGGVLGNGETIVEALKDD